MRSSTLNKPKISKERIEALDELISDKSSYDSSPGVYVRTDKDRELDILWQGFKINSKEDRSPGIYLLMGFITGIICTVLMTSILNMGNPSNESSSDLNLWKKANTEVKQKNNNSDAVNNLSVTPASQSDTNARTEQYQIKDGDSLAAIAIRYYGSASPANVEKIQKANNLVSPDQISAGKELLIPLD